MGWSSLVPTLKCVWVCHVSCIVHCPEHWTSSESRIMLSVLVPIWGCTLFPTGCNLGITESLANHNVSCKQQLCCLTPTVRDVSFWILLWHCFYKASLPGGTTHSISVPRDTGVGEWRKESQNTVEPLYVPIGSSRSPNCCQCLSCIHLDVSSHLLSSAVPSSYVDLCARAHTHTQANACFLSVHVPSCLALSLFLTMSYLRCMCLFYSVPQDPLQMTLSQWNLRHSFITYSTNLYYLLCAKNSIRCE